MNYDNTNKGAIWGNQKKHTDKHPDYTGSVNIEGKEFWVSAWKRGANDTQNAPALRFSFTPKDQTVVNNTQPQYAPPPQNDFTDDDIPFNWEAA